MRAFADQITFGLQSLGHKVEEITAPVLISRLLSRNHPAAKWLGYVDQFLIFPPLLLLRAVLLPKGTLCVLSDQALGPWLPWLGGRSHLIHCHDLLALEASFGHQPFHKLSRFGRWYQRWILSGFKKGRCFLSVSAATKFALERQLPKGPLLSSVLYNPLSPRFSVIPKEQARASLREAVPQIDQSPFLFHIGRNWYKNRLGVLSIWEQLHRMGCPHHLVLVGSLDKAMHSWIEQRSQLSAWLHVLPSASDEFVLALYNLAAALVFPSHAEGFGWPILEAMACGCPVLTTDRPPMTEVGGEAVTVIPPAPAPPESLAAWAHGGAVSLQQMLQRSTSQKEKIRKLGFVQSRRFAYGSWLDQLESCYKQALTLQKRRS
ncbi:glycosyltransferase [Synechococcus sp. MIT S9510]